MTRCVICGRFMSDDQVLLGCSRDLAQGGQEYAHQECAVMSMDNRAWSDDPGDWGDEA